MPRKLFFFPLGVDDFIGGLDSSSSGEQGSEASAEAAERAREQRAKAAQQATRDKREERKRRQYDNTLAQIIVQFLSDPRYSGFFILISRIFAKNIPSDIILAILSLIHKDSAKAIAEKNIERKELPKGADATPFPPELSLPLKEWTTVIFSVASAEPHKALETLLDINWDIDVNVEQLLSLVLNEFFSYKKFETPFENVQQFSKAFLSTLVGDLESQIQNQVLLEGEEDDL